MRRLSYEIKFICHAQSKKDWDGNAKEIVLMDNNILALPEHFALICKQAREHRIKVDFNQGLDHRLLTPEIADLLASISHKEYHFAFDNIAYLPTVEHAIGILKTVGINRAIWYVLVGFDSTYEEDLQRLDYLRNNNQNAYVQRYSREDKYIPLARWANQHHIFQCMTWEQFINRPENRRYRCLI